MSCDLNIFDEIYTPISFCLKTLNLSCFVVCILFITYNNNLLHVTRYCQRHILISFEETRIINVNIYKYECDKYYE